MAELIKEPIFWALIAWILKDTIAQWRAKDKEYTQAIKELTKEMMELKLAIIQNKAQIETLTEEAKDLKKMKHDLNAAHSRLKNLAPHLYNEQPT